MLDLVVLRQPQPLLPPLRVRDFSFPDHVTERMWAAANTRKSQSGLWHRAATSDDGERPLHIVILGASITSGCGAGEGTASFCDYAQSWSRVFASKLQARLASSTASSLRWRRVRVSVSYKNAVGVDYFGRCSRQHVPRDAHLLLLETGSNVRKGTDLKALVTLLRRAAPRAAVLFLVFPPRLSLATPHKRRVTSSSLLGAAHQDHPLQVMTCATSVDDIVARDAADADADAIHLAPILAWLSGNDRCSWANRSRYGQWYAADGKDTVHPTPRGHALIGSVAARVVAQRLEEAASGPSSSKLLSSPSASSDRASSATLADAAPEADSEWELCYDAEEMPLRPGAATQALQSSSRRGGGSFAAATQRGWTLHDEGSHKGAIGHWRHVSNTPGDVLPIGPLPGPAGSHRHRSRAGGADEGQAADESDRRVR